VRRDRIDRGGGVTLRYDSRLGHIKVGARHAGTRVLLLVAGLDVRIVSEDGELLRELTIDPSRVYQPMGEGGTMSRDTCERCPETSQMVDLAGRCVNRLPLLSTLRGEASA
jgi:hypothetical protein